MTLLPDTASTNAGPMTSAHGDKALADILLMGMYRICTQGAKALLQHQLGRSPAIFRCNCERSSPPAPTNRCPWAVYRSIGLATRSRSLEPGFQRSHKQMTTFPEPVPSGFSTACPNGLCVFGNSSILCSHCTVWPTAYPLLEKSWQHLCPSLVQYMRLMLF